MSLHAPKHIGVIGSGRMGTDIFYFLADYDFHLTWKCIDEDERNRIQAAYSRKMERLVKNGLITGEAPELKKEKVLITSSIADLHDCDLIIESMQENAADKARFFIDLAAAIGERTVVVTNTSSIRPSLLIADEKMKSRFAGLHFFYPVKLKNILEMAVTDATDSATVAILQKFISYIGRFHLEMHEDEAFLLNRMFLDFQAQAFRFHHDDGLDIGAIDRAIKKSLFPVGVFDFFDSVGLDVISQSIANYTESMAGIEFYRPLMERLNDLLSRHRLGRKSGAGFYSYPDRDAGGSLTDDETPEAVIQLLGSVYINSFFKDLEKKIWSRDDLEYAVKEYMGVETGPFELAAKIGHETIKMMLNEHYKKTGFDVYRPSVLL